MLSDRDILDLIQNNQLRIEGFREENLTPNGYDLTIGEVLIPSVGSKIQEGSLEIPSITWFLVGTKEIVSLPEDVVAQLWIRTSWARKGVLGSFGKIDAGFSGNLTLSAFNASNIPLEISVGDKFAQLVIITLRTCSTKPYEKRSGNYQDQRGITLEPRKLM